MSTLRNHPHAPINDERDLTALEYGGIAGRTAVVIVTSTTTLGSKPSGACTSIAVGLP